MAKIEKTKKEVDLKDIKEELFTYIDKEIKRNYEAEIDKANRRLIKEKNKKIIFRNIVIIILLAVIFLLLILMYKDNYFNNFFKTNKEVEKVKVVVKEEQKEVIEEEEKEPTLDELIEKYSWLLDKVVISEKSNYIETFYEGNITNELKNYLTLNSMQFDSLNIEDDCYLIEDDLFKEAYQEIFNDEYISTSFTYNNVKIRFINKLMAYISDEMFDKEKSNIKKEIVNIEIKDEEIVIETVEGIIKNNKLYNSVTKKEIANYKNDGLIKHKNQLNSMRYKFIDNKLISIDI